MMAMMQMPAVPKLPATMGKGGTGKAGKTSDSAETAFGEALDSATSPDAKGRKAETPNADLLAMLLAALQGQIGSFSQPAAGADASSGTAGDGRSETKVGSAGAPNQETSVRISGQTDTDRLSALLGLSEQDRSALAETSAADRANLAKLLTGQKDLPDPFVQRLQAALAKADPRLLRQLQARPVEVTATSAANAQDQLQPAQAAAAAAEPAQALRPLPAGGSHAGRTTALSQHQIEAEAARPAVPTAASDSASHAGKDGTGQKSLQGGGAELLAKTGLKAETGRTGADAGFSLAGLPNPHGSGPSLQAQHQMQGDGKLQLPSGAAVSEQHVVDQVVKGVGGAQVKETSSITVKMHPEELGQVKLELTMGKDGLKAHLHAQTQQVQDVLEKHLPKLRHALEQQGLRLDEMQVSVDSGRDGGRGFFFQQQQQGSPTPFQSIPRWSGTRTMPAAALDQPAASAGAAMSGLSVRI